MVFQQPSSSYHYLHNIRISQTHFAKWAEKLRHSHICIEQQQHSYCIFNTCKKHSIWCTKLSNSASFVLCKNQDITKSQRHHFIDRRRMQHPANCHFCFFSGCWNFLFCRLLDILEAKKQSLLPEHILVYTKVKLIRTFKVTGQLVSEVLIWVQVAYANL